MKNNLFIIVFFIKCIFLFGQNNTYIPKKYLNQYVISLTEINQVINKYKNTSKDLIKYLPLNYVKSGKVDYTSYIQNGINQNDVVIMPDFPILINEKGLNLKNNSVLIFKKNSKLILKGNRLENYNIINMKNIQNAKIYFASIEGDRFKHIGNKGEWGMGIGVWSSTNIFIYKPSVKFCWGDGIYLNDVKNIKIYQPLLNNNRRNGISIISGEDIEIDNLLSANHDGTLPKAGIDIEPNNNNEILKSITINNPITFNNFRGYLIVTNQFYGAKNKNVSINLKNPIDEFSWYSIAFYFLRNIKYNSTIDGEISVISPKFIKPKKEYIFKKTNIKDGIKINFKGDIPDEISTSIKKVLNN